MKKRKRKKGNYILTPDEFTQYVMDLALKHAKGDKKLAAKLVVAFAGGLNSGPMRMG